jgi:broad specificity phosphatase PhoE
MVFWGRVAGAPGPCSPDRVSSYPAPELPKLIVVRHGETEWSEQGRHTGRTDVPLLESGRAQARHLTGALGAMAFALVLTSPLSRAAETCALAGFGDRAEVSDDLLEWDYGDYEGRTTTEIREDRPGWTLWADGVPGGETAGAVGRRCDHVIERARGVNGDTLCFAHSHVLRTLAARWVGLPPIGGRLMVLDACSIGILGWEREVPIIERWNEPSPG